MANLPAPKPDPVVEALFESVMVPPPGHDYYRSDGQLLYPVYGQDQWRLLLLNKATGELTPVFLDGDFIRKLTKALHAMQRELNGAVSSDIPAPVRH